MGRRKTGKKRKAKTEKQKRMQTGRRRWGSGLW